MVILNKFIKTKINTYIHIYWFGCDVPQLNFKFHLNKIYNNQMQIFDQDDIIYTQRPELYIIFGYYLM